MLVEWSLEENVSNISPIGSLGIYKSMDHEIRGSNIYFANTKQQ